MPAFDVALLRPLHIGGFTLAWGWWLLIIVIIFTIVCLGIYCTKRWYKNAYRRVALRELLACDPRTLDCAAYLQQVNTVLKFTAMHTFNPTEVAALTGHKWLEFLDRHWQQKKHRKFINTTGKMLALVPYIKNHTANIDDLIYLKQLALTWIKKHKC
jgi:hypothetical protein